MVILLTKSDMVEEKNIEDIKLTDAIKFDSICVADTVYFIGRKKFKILKSDIWELSGLILEKEYLKNYL